jgi:hypothetical protein
MANRRDVETFIRATFRSVWTLELLRFLRQNRDRGLSHAEMVAELRGSDLVVTQSLSSLSAAGLIAGEAEGGARYGPVSPELDALAEEAIRLYARSPNAVRRMIVSAANPDIAAFADAFRLRRD